MIIRSVLRAHVPRIAGKRASCIPARSFRAARRYSTSSSSSSSTAMASSAPQSQAAMLATITSDLDRIAPRFEMFPEQIEIIQTPAEFYQTLKVGRPFIFFFSSLLLQSLLFYSRCGVYRSIAFLLSPVTSISSFTSRNFFNLSCQDPSSCPSSFPPKPKEPTKTT